MTKHIGYRGYWLEKHADGYWHYSMPGYPDAISGKVWASLKEAKKVIDLRLKKNPKAPRGKKPT